MSLFIDTHCHLDAPEFAPDRDAMRAAARSAGVAHCVIPAVDRGNWEAVRALAHGWGDSYALGIHPLCTPGAQDADLQALAALLEQHCGDERLVALGEIGLDYFAPGLDSAHQEAMLRAQLRLARRFDLPVLLHVRKSVDRVHKALRELPVAGGIAHAFNGSAQQAQTFIDMGFRLGFGGALTFERARHLRRLAAELPLDALVLETDAPDIPPQWLYRSRAERAAGAPQGRNSPAELPRIARELAALRGIEPEALAQACTRNALAALPRLAPLLRSAP
ncbi:TatD family hydrolase [Comamonas flocculans]|uniref:TatD family deoxyribonuclease n=1 Tax=Comamonas flocculans TaxID=2597701 RepID=A0A5B8RVG1_9BURK|nr:TatD family hydrolase [Comamonas flocculans]QEA13501.1 TatD family deoxyribonuclease [Comamonas flocculans]